MPYSPSFSPKTPTPDILTPIWRVEEDEIPTTPTFEEELKPEEPLFEGEELDVDSSSDVPFSHLIQQIGGYFRRGLHQQPFSVRSF